MRHRLLAAVLPLALLALPLHAQFTPNGGSFGSLPQATFGGTGIPNNAVMQGRNLGNAGGNVVLGLTATARYSSPLVTDNGAGTYFATPGFNAPNRAMWNFDFFVGGTGASNYFYTLFIDNNAGSGTTTFLQYDFDATAFTTYTDPTTNAPARARQDSWNIGFGSIGGNPAASGEYTYALAQYNDAQRSSLVDDIAIQVNVSATPEPASLVLLATGLLGIGGIGGIGGIVRSRRA